MWRFLGAKERKSPPEWASKLGLPNLQDAFAVQVVVPVPALEDAVDEGLRREGCVHFGDSLGSVGCF